MTAFRPFSDLLIHADAFPMPACSCIRARLELAVIADFAFLIGGFNFLTVPYAAEVLFPHRRRGFQLAERVE